MTTEDEVIATKWAQIHEIEHNLCAWDEKNFDTAVALQRDRDQLAAETAACQRAASRNATHEKRLRAWEDTLKQAQQECDDKMAVAAARSLFRRRGSGRREDSDEGMVQTRDHATQTTFDDPSMWGSRRDRATATPEIEERVKAWVEQSTARMEELHRDYVQLYAVGVRRQEARERRDTGQIDTEGRKGKRLPASLEEEMGEREMDGREVEGGDQQMD